MFAALSTVEPPIVEREAAMILEKHKDWYAARQLILDERARERVGELANHLGDREWLDDQFLLMVTVLRRLESGERPGRATAPRRVSKPHRLRRSRQGPTRVQTRKGGL
jgi:hypothetical protein